MTKNEISNRNKKPWPTKDAMAQVYEKNLWGGTAQFYSGLGSHHPEIVGPYLEEVSSFLKSFDSPPMVCDFGCGDFNIGKELVKYTKHYIGIDIVPALIAYNQKQFKAPNLEFKTLDIATEKLPTADCAILRQVLQHLSNAEIKELVAKLYNYKYILLTEHLPAGDFEPNKDIISGQGIRLKKHSGVRLTASPFYFKPKAERKLISVKSPKFKGVIETTLYVVK